MPKQFHNPYQFIPVTGTVNGEKTSSLEFDEVLSGSPFVRHDRWDDNSYSGRMLCRLRTLSPLIVGATHDPAHENTHPKPIPQYQNQAGVSIPGNSLRGMVSSVAEAISQSSMRVLGEVGSRDSIYSVRKDMQHSLKAIGMVHRDDKENITITPIAMVAMPLEGMQIPAKWQKVFGKDTPLRECVASYVGNYKDRKNDVTKALNSGTLKSYQHLAHKRYHSMALRTPKDLRVSSKIKPHSDYLHMRGPVLLGQTYTDLQDGVNSQKVNGVVYVVGGRGKNNKMPRKKHELFLPFDASTLDRTPLSVPDNLLPRFENVLRQRFKDEAQKVYLPEGYNRRSALAFDSQRDIVQTGDLLYFDVNKQGDTVTDVSYTAIWRDVVAGSLSESLISRSGINTLPWGHEHRTALSPAEQLFGVVEDQKKKKHKLRDGDATQNSRSLASRIRFFDAIAENADLTLMEATPLKILASPKPPSPALYCSRQGYVKKSDLDFSNSPGATEINGRKRYIPQPKANPNTWTTQKPDENEQQKVICTPIPNGEAFYFHIDFDNLSEAELGLLTAAVAPGCLGSSDKSYQHQLGMGKPFGFGQIAVDRMGTFLIDKKARYSKLGLLNTARYSQWFDGNEKLSAACEALYPAEYKAAQSLDKENDVALQQFQQYIDQQSLDILLTISDASNVTHPVCYPFVDSEDYYSESEGYSWFVRNDSHKKAKKDRQALRPVEAGKTLPTLNTN